MLSKKNRISRHIFPIVFTGKKYSSLNIYMRVARLNKEERRENRFSFVVSKKAVKNAVDRNNLRRMGYNVIQKKSIHINKGYLITFFFKKNTADLSRQAIEQEVVLLLNKANLLK